MNRLFAIVTLLLILGCVEVMQDALPSPTDDDSINNGRKLVQGLAACGYCHGDTRSPRSILSGGQERKDKYGRVNAPNLTPDETGIKDWSAYDIVRALRGSINPNEEFLSKEVHKGYEWMSDKDIYSITAYLKTLPPVRNQIERRKLGFLARNTTGFFDAWREVRGHVPEIGPGYKLARGQYLVDHVARCGSCHNSPTGVFGGENYLVGGKLVENDSGEKIAPSITNALSSGLGGWSKEDIVEYLKTGTNPSDETIDPNFCPWDFFKNSDDKDLLDIAEYLKTVG